MASEQGWLMPLLGVPFTTLPPPAVVILQGLCKDVLVRLERRPLPVRSYRAGQKLAFSQPLSVTAAALLLKRAPAILFFPSSCFPILSLGPPSCSSSAYGLLYSTSFYSLAFKNVLHWSRLSLGTNFLWVLLFMNRRIEFIVITDLFGFLSVILVTL